MLRGMAERQGEMKVKIEVQQMIDFQRFNLNHESEVGEGPFDIILCRNVLIYFNQRLQNKVLNLFYESLCPFGFLALGNKESLLFTDRRKMFEEVDKKERIFIKTG